MNNIAALSELGLCPRIYASFQNGLVYGYVDGDVLNAKDMLTPQFSELIIQEVARWHNIDFQFTPQISVSADPCLISVLEKWIDLIPADYIWDGRSKNELVAESKLLLGICDNLESPLVFCHNDLQSGNLVYNSDNESISLIDYEYAGMNYRGFDIANHFNEFGGLNGDWNAFPKKEFRIQWYKKYLMEMNQKRQIENYKPGKEELEIMDKEILAFATTSHFYWSIWSIIQSIHSDIEFDYVKYGVGRLREYYSKKSEWL